MPDPAQQTVFPLTGHTLQTSGVTTGFHAAQSRAPGFTGSLPELHQGVDLAAKEGDPVQSANAGTVISAGFDTTGFGNTVLVQNPNGTTTRYAHLSAMSVKPGQQLQPGTPIGAVGHTGNATGPHLHFEIQSERGAIDPTPQLQNAAPTGGLTMGTTPDTTTPPTNAYIDKLKTQSAAYAEKANNAKIVLAYMDDPRPMDAWLAAVNKDKTGADVLTKEDVQAAMVDVGYQDLGKNPAAKDISAQKSAIQKKLDGYVTTQQTFDDTIAKEQAALTKPPAPKSQVQQFGSAAAPDWRAYNEATGQWESMPNQPAPAPTTASERASSGLYSAQAGAQKTPDQVAAEVKSNLALQQGQTAEANANANKITTELANKQQEYATQRGALAAQLAKGLQDGSVTPDDATKQMAQFESLWISDADRFKKTLDTAAALEKSTGIVHDPITGQPVMDPATGQPQLTVERQQKLQEEAVAGSTERRGIATLAEELESNQVGSSIFFNRNNPAGQKAAMQVAGPPNESLGMRILRQMGYVPDAQTGLLTAQPVQPGQGQFAPGVVPDQTVAPVAPGQPATTGAVPAPAPAPVAASPSPEVAAAQAAPPVVATPVQQDQQRQADTGTTPGQQPINPFWPKPGPVPTEAPIQVPAAYYQNQTANDLGNGQAQNTYIDPTTGQPVNVGDPYAIAGGGGGVPNALPWVPDQNAGRTLVPAAYGATVPDPEAAQGGGCPVRPSYPVAYARAA